MQQHSCMPRSSPYASKRAVNPDKDRTLLALFVQYEVFRRTLMPAWTNVLCLAAAVLQSPTPSLVLFSVLLLMIWVGYLSTRHTGLPIGIP